MVPKYTNGNGYKILATRPIGLNPSILFCVQREIFVWCHKLPDLKLLKVYTKVEEFFVVKENVMIYILSDQTKSRMITDVQVKIFNILLLLVLIINI